MQTHCGAISAHCTNACSFIMHGAFFSTFSTMTAELMTILPWSLRTGLTADARIRPGWGDEVSSTRTLTIDEQRNNHCSKFYSSSSINQTILQCVRMPMAGPPQNTHSCVTSCRCIVETLRAATMNESNTTNSKYLNQIQLVNSIDGHFFSSCRKKKFARFSLSHTHTQCKGKGQIYTRMYWILVWTHLYYRRIRRITGSDYRRLAVFVVCDSALWRKVFFIYVDFLCFSRLFLEFNFFGLFFSDLVAESVYVYASMLFSCYSDTVFWSKIESQEGCNQKTEKYR